MESRVKCFISNSKINNNNVNNESKLIEIRNRFSFGHCTTMTSSFNLHLLTFCDRFHKNLCFELLTKLFSGKSLR